MKISKLGLKIALKFSIGLIISIVSITSILIYFLTKNGDFVNFKLPVQCFFIIIPLFFCFVVITYLFALNSLKPVRDMIKAAKEIVNNNIDKLLPVLNSDDELDELSKSFNQVFIKLKNDFESEQQFSSNVSHELKTPIAVISGQANLLRRWGKDNPQQLELSLSKIIDEAESMQHIISSLSQMSKIEHNLVQLDYQEILLQPFYERLIDEVHTLQPNVKINLMNKTGAKFFCDYELLHQVFMIIITNSIKFCNESGILDIIINIFTEFNDKNVTFRIVDNGPGFSEDILPKVFERFFKGDVSHNRNDGGHGLGLSIAKSIVTLLHGEIKAENEPQTHGAIVLITFPTFL